MLRIALAVDSFQLPAWQHRAIEAVRKLDGAEIVCVFVGAPPPRQPWSLLYRVYLRLDERLFGGEGVNAFAQRDVRSLLPDCPAEADDLDVVLKLGDHAPAGVEARLGIWTLPDAHGGALEVLHGEPTTEARLVVDGRVALRSLASTDHVSAHRNRINNCWKMAAFPARALRDPAVLEPAETAAPARPAPGNFAMLGLLARLGARYARKKVRDLLSLEQWYVAYRFDERPRGPDDVFRDLVPLIPPKDRFWADPFPFKKDGRSYLFVEQLHYSNWRGHIAVIEIDPETGAGAPRKVLERNYHLSYPLVFAWEGEVYMLPETSSARRVQLFRCTEFPDRWTEDRILLDGVNAVDATLFEHDDRWWMFVNIGQPGASNWDELHLYHAETPLGPWAPHPRNPVKSDCRSARPAGRPFRWDGALYRPAQDCSGEYGRAIALNRVLELTVDAYREEFVKILAPDPATRTHTVNEWRGIHVVDLMRRPRRWP